MFDDLAAEIEGLAIPPDGAAIAAAVALRDRLEAKIAEAVAAFDAASLWDLDSATSITAWLRHQAGMTSRDAARSAARSKRLANLPATQRAWQAGELTTGQVDAITAALRPHTIGLFAEHEADLVPSLVGLSVADTARAMAAWAAHAGSLTDGEHPAEPERALQLSKTLDGCWAVDGTFGAPAGEVVATAVRLAQSPDSEAEPARTPAERRADALVDVCRFFLDHQAHRPGGRHRPHVNVMIDLDAVVDGASMHTLLCDSAVHRFVTAGRSAVLDYGTTTRTIPAPLWNALVLRDEHCRFPSCDRTASWCEGHHVADGGPTCLANLVLVCTRHHHRLHQPGWHAKLRPDATFEVTDPAGRHWSTAPPRAGPVAA